MNTEVIRELYKDPYDKVAEKDATTQRINILGAFLGQRYVDEERDFYISVLGIIQEANSSALYHAQKEQEYKILYQSSKDEYGYLKYTCDINMMKYEVSVKRIIQESIPQNYINFGAVMLSLSIIFGMIYIFELFRGQYILNSWLFISLFLGCLALLITDIFAVREYKKSFK